MSEKNQLEVVRVKDPVSGAEYNATRAHAKNIKATVLEGKPVRDKYGRPVPTRPTPGKSRTDLAGQPTKKTTTEKTTTPKKES